MKFWRSTGVVRGLCTNPGPHKGQLCAINSDCDSSVGSGDGVCNGRFVASSPPLGTENICTTFAPIQVPLKQTGAGFRAGRATLKTKTTSSADAKGIATLKLTCEPHM